ncbi:unnamed protein product [Absidia cylindrospora]
MTVSKQPSKSAQGSNSSCNTNIWSSILKNVASSKMVQTKNILILGDPSSGKSSLIQHLQNKVAVHEIISEGQPSKTQQQPQHPINNGKAKHLALGFTYTNICDEDNEETARLGIYQLSVPEHSALLKFVLNMEMITGTMILVVLDWSQPWSFVAKLQQWMQVVDQALHSLCHQHPMIKTTLEGLRKKELDYMRHYADIELMSDGLSSSSPSPGMNGIAAHHVTLPLTDGTLINNYGIPIAVVCCKSDEQSRLERMSDYKEDQFDYIQQTLRTICMKYGAALFYTSTLYPQTFSHLRQYILHRTLSTNISNRTSSSYSVFQQKAQVVDRDTLMVPAGWDSWGKIKALQESFDCQHVCDHWDIDMSNLADRQPTTDQGIRFLFEQVIVDIESDYKPVVVPSITVCEDEHEFLKRHFDSLQRGGQSSTNKATSPTSSAQGNIHHPQPSLVGPLDISATSSLDTIYATESSLPISSTNSAHYSKDMDTPMKKLAWDKLNKGTTVPLTCSASDTRTNTGNTILSGSTSENVSRSNTTTGTSNEILTNFFQSLLSKKTTPLTSSVSSSSSSPSSNYQDTTEKLDTTTKKSTQGSGLVNRQNIQSHLTHMQQQQHSLHS